MSQSTSPAPFTREVTELQILHEDVPDGDDVADAAGEDEEMEDGMHIFPFVQTVEDGAGDVADTFADNPDEGGSGHAVDEGFESDEYAEAHSDETKSFHGKRVPRCVRN